MAEKQPHPCTQVILATYLWSLSLKIDSVTKTKSYIATMVITEQSDIIL